MKKTTTNLDDLFAAARHEEPVISEENARNLLTKSEHLQSTSFIFSTKGIIMSTIGLSLAAFIGYLALSGSPQAPISQSTIINTPASNLLAHSVSQSIEEPKKSDDKVVKKLIIVRKSNDEVPTPPVPPLPPMISTPLKVDGIKPFEVSSSKFEKLGITKEDDGEVFFSQKTKEGKIFSVSFTGSDMIVIGDNNPKNITDAPTFAPVIVTDTKGNKRLMQLSTEANGIKMNALEVESRSDNDTGSTTREIMNGLKISALNIEQDSNITFKINIPGKHGDDDIELNLNNDPHSKHPMISHHRSISMKKIIHFDSLLKAKAITVDNVEEVLKDINFDSTFFNSKNFNFNISGDEVEIDNSGQIANSDINVDSIYKAANGIVKEVEVKIKSIKIDSMIEDASKRGREAIEKVKKMNMDSIIRLCQSANEKAIKMMAGYDRELNALIPILVRTSTTEHFSKAEGVTYDDGIIFWYKPAKEINDIIPEVQTRESTARVQNRILVIAETFIFPNPAKNSTTIRFTVAEPCTLAFSIHDLLGKRVLDGGSIAETSAGSYEHEINLSQLTAGVYLLVITTDKGEQTMQRLVIEK